MILWGGVIGAAIGWATDDFDGTGLILGGLCGLLLGWIMRRAVRAEVRRLIRDLRAEMAVPIVDRAASGPPSYGVARADTTSVAAPSGRLTEYPAEPSIADTGPPVGDRSVPELASSPVGDALGHAVRDAVALARGWLFGGNMIVRLGLVILFVGLSFLARYAASAGLFPIELRLAAIVTAGLALLGVGFRTRAARPGFALALQGGGIAVVYLTLFAAARLYDTIPVGAAFALMILVCALGCALALMQDAQELAVPAFAGGFAVPLLLADGPGDPLLLFGYFTILNLAVLYVAGRRTWRALGLVGFAATFGGATLWGLTAYAPAHFAAAELFLILSVVIYLAAGVRHARATPGRFGQVVDGTLLFGPAFAGFGLQVGLVGDLPFGSAFAALGFAALYLALAWWGTRQRGADFRVLNEATIAIAIGFVTLAVPLALGARWTSSAWAVEGACAVWIGIRQGRWLPRLFGLLLQPVAALLFLDTLGPEVAAVPLTGPGLLGALPIALSALAIAWWLRTPPPRGGTRIARAYAHAEARIPAPAFLLGFGAAWLAVVRELARQMPGALPPAYDPGARPALTALAFVVGAWAADRVGRRQGWPVATWPGRVALPVLAAGFAGGGHLVDHGGWAIWPVAVALHFVLLFRNDRAPGGVAARRLARAAHAGTVWLGTAMLVDCLSVAIRAGGLDDGAWAGVLFVGATVAVLAALTFLPTRTPDRWPFDGDAATYPWFAAAPIALLVYLGTLMLALFAEGRTDPLPYVPLLNPIDLTVALALATLLGWRRAVMAIVPAPPGSGPVRGRGALLSLAALGFLAVNMLWLRTAHHMLGVGWGVDALLDSFLVQTGLAILWTLLALVLMVAAHRRAARPLWLAGAGLLALVVLKLLLVDLGNAGGGERIVAFLGVGVLMLVVGYMAPLPPRTPDGPDMPAGTVAA